jgi:hypothetical protein
MPIMLVRNKVEDYSTWRSVFDAQKEAGRKAGLHLIDLWRDIEDPNNVFFTMKVDDIEKARAYVSAPESAEVGERAGVIDGELHIVEQVTDGVG